MFVCTCKNLLLGGSCISVTVIMTVTVRACACDVNYLVFLSIIDSIGAYTFSD